MTQQMDQKIINLEKHLKFFRDECLALSGQNRTQNEEIKLMKLELVKAQQDKVCEHNALLKVQEKFEQSQVEVQKLKVELENEKRSNSMLSQQLAEANIIHENSLKQQYEQITGSKFLDTDITDEDQIKNKSTQSKYHLIQAEYPEFRQMINLVLKNKEKKEECYQLFLHYIYEKTKDKNQLFLIMKEQLRSMRKMEQIYKEFVAKSQKFGQNYSENKMRDLWLRCVNEVKLDIMRRNNKGPQLQQPGVDEV